MHTLLHYLYVQACNNAWSNHRLLRACMLLSDADFAAARTSFFPSIKATLNHNLTVDWYYVDALERGVRQLPPNSDIAAFFTPEEPFESCQPLSLAQHTVDRRLVDLCAQLRDDDLTRTVQFFGNAGARSESLSRLLAHLFQHQIHHRGQAHAMLAGSEVAPPQLDEFFSADEADLRARDLAELDLSEAQIWQPRG